MTRWLLSAASLAFAIALVADPLNDEPILGLANRFRLAWNQHDMTAMAELFTQDADFVNVGGARFKGREKIRDEHAKLHRMQFKE
ncbi:MAG TPA: SgcJ/EcaC family oxidoreductase, partial [Thermoanaerobaculia bacterium]